MATREHDIGVLAIAQHAARLKVEAWLREEGKNGHFVTAGNSPFWPDYEIAEKAFEDALQQASTTVDDVPNCGSENDWRKGR